MQENQGWILLHRKIQDSQIWNKPDSWLKIWVYILLNVGFKDKRYPRGTYYFRYEWIAKDCNTSYDTVRRCVEWLREATQIATQKATHGIIISVLTYAKYQDQNFIKSQTESHEETQTEARQKPDRSHNTSKECKEDKKCKEVITSEPSSQVNDIFNIFYEINPTINYGNITMRKSAQRLINKLGAEKALGSARAAVAVFGKQYAPSITTPSQLETKLAELVGYYKKQQVNPVVDLDDIRYQ